MTNRLEQVGVQAVLAGAAQYVRDAQQVNSATAQIAKETDRAANQTRASLQGTKEDAVSLSTAAGGLAGSLGVLIGPFDDIISRGRDMAQSLIEGAQAAGTSGLTGALVGLIATGASAVLMFTGLGIAGTQWAVESQRITSITGLNQQQAELYSTALQLVGGDSQSLVRVSFLLERQLTGTAEAMKAGQKPSTDLTRALSALGISWRTTNGDVRDMGTLLPEIIDRLGKLDDKQKASNLSTQIFGRFGVEVTRVIGDYANVMPEATRLTDEFSTAEHDAAAIALEWEGTQVRLQQAFQSLAADTLPAFIGIANKVVDAITGWVHANGEAFIENLNRAMLAGAHAVEVFAEGFTAILGPALHGAAAGIALLSGALSHIPPEAVDWLLRIAGAATGIGLTTAAIVLLGGAVTTLTADLVIASAALLLTPAGWIALAGVLGVAAIGYAALKPGMDATAAGLRDEAEGRKLAAAATLDELRAKAAALSAEREENVERLNGIKVIRGSNTEREALMKTIAAQDARLRELAAAIGISTAKMKELDAANKVFNPGGEATTTVFEQMGFAAGTTAEDIKKMSSEMITATLLAAHLRRAAANAADSFETGRPVDPFAVVNSEAFRSDLNKVLGLYKEARKEAEAAAEANTQFVNSAGYLTAAQQSAAESAARAAQQASEAYARFVEKMVADAAAAAKRIRDAQVSELDQLGSLLASALRASYAEQLRITQESLNQQRELVNRVYDERIDGANRAAQAEIAAIDSATDAVLAGINAQIAALRGMDEAEDREQLVRKVALTYDAKEHDAAERDLRQFDRRVQANALSEQARSIQEQARARKDQIEDDLRDRLEALEKERDAAKKTFDFADKAARETYAKQTEEFTIQSEVRKLLMDKEQTQYVQDMIQKYAPQWQIAGISMGQQLLIGIRAQIEPYLRSLQNLIPGSSGGGPGSPSQAAVDSANYMAALQSQGQAALAGGAPDSALNSLRENVIQQGGIPSFDRGLDWGRVPKPMLAELHTGEVVLTPEQQAEFMGGAKFERGAFDGMFRGANFNGDPKENARAIRTEMQEFMRDQTGRGSFLSGNR